LLGVKGLANSTSKSQPLLQASSDEAPAVIEILGSSSDDKLPEKTPNAAGNENQLTPRKPGRAKAAIDPEKAVEKAARVCFIAHTNSMANCLINNLQEKERLEKKAAKAEKERKDKEFQDKARSIMVNFFGKPKASSSTASSPSKGPAVPSSTMSDFDRVFKPFVLKKDAELAPVNWFRDERKRKRLADADVIVIDEDDTDVRDVEMYEPDVEPEASPRSEYSPCFGGSKFTKRP